MDPLAVIFVIQLNERTTETFSTAEIHTSSIRWVSFFFHVTDKIVLFSSFQGSFEHQTTVRTEEKANVKHRIKTVKPSASTKSADKSNNNNFIRLFTSRLPSISNNCYTLSNSPEPIKTTFQRFYTSNWIVPSTSYLLKLETYERHIFE